MNRRRFIAIAGASLLAGPSAVRAERHVWHGRALGADAMIALEGRGADSALQAALGDLARIERLFSIHHADSALSRLNRKGSLAMPTEFADLVAICERAHDLTGGAFDPTVQPLFVAMAAAGGSIGPAQLRDLLPGIGWKKLRIEGHLIAFGAPGMGITFNGVAQGFATDRVAETLRNHGFDRVAINIGEWRAGGLPVRLTVASPLGQALRRMDISNGSVATSSPSGTRFADGSGHILRPDGSGASPRWQTVSVEAGSAAIADALSTGLCLAPDEGLARRLVAAGDVRSILLQDAGGDITLI